jgi:Zn-dependent protease
MSIDFIFSILILMFSVVAHEVAHGYSAYLLGDNTAEYQGRLTLNPFKHLEWFGSLVLPTLSYLFGGFIIGWAKPVPFNPYNLKYPRFGEAIVAFAGPLANIMIAVSFGLLVRWFGQDLDTNFASISLLIVFTNLLLAVFNLIPIPPLDGSKILFSLFPNSLYKIRAQLEVYGSFLLLFFVFFLWGAIEPIVYGLLHIIVGN